MEKRMEKTDYKITEFHNSEFGSIRMIEDGGRLLFSGIDVAFALGYILANITSRRSHHRPDTWQIQKNMILNVVMKVI